VLHDCSCTLDALGDAVTNAAGFLDMKEVTAVMMERLVVFGTCAAAGPQCWRPPPRPASNSAPWWWTRQHRYGPVQFDLVCPSGHPEFLQAVQTGRLLAPWSQLQFLRISLKEFSVHDLKM